jgi:DNA-binding MarR family transcriptional regulator
MPKSGKQPPFSRKDELREFIADLFAAAAGMQALRRAIGKSINLGSVELAIMLAIWRLKPTEKIGIKSLAEHLHVAGPHITDEVTRLVRRKYLRKSVDSGDRRAVNLELTDKALALLASLAPMLDRINTHLFRGVTDRDTRILRASFQKLIERSASAINLLQHRRTK